MASAEEQIAALEIALPPVAKPRWTYAPAVRSGNLVFVSGQIGTEGGRILHPGKLGREVDVARGAEAARACALSALAVVRQELASLDRVSRVVKLTVFVASAEGFSDQPTVANGASDLLRDVFGDDAGVGARSAVGVAELPLGASVEAEFVFEVNTSSCCRGLRQHGCIYERQLFVGEQVAQDRGEQRRIHAVEIRVHLLDHAVGVVDALPRALDLVDRKIRLLAVLL